MASAPAGWTMHSADTRTVTVSRIRHAYFFFPPPIQPPTSGSWLFSPPPPLRQHTSCRCQPRGAGAHTLTRHHAQVTISTAAKTSRFHMTLCFLSEVCGTQSSCCTLCVHFDSDWREAGRFGAAPGPHPVFGPAGLLDCGMMRSCGTEESITGS